MKLIYLLPLALLAGACNSDSVSVDPDAPHSINNDSTQTEVVPDGAVDTTMESNPVITNLQYTNEVFETKGLGWGYRIYDNGVLFINQPHIPAIQGNKGFSTKEKAQITADFAVMKMEQGFIPPTISPEELDSLGVLD